MRIYLSCAQRLMAKKFLNDSEIGAVVEHVSSETVAEGMRADLGVESGLKEVFIEFTSDRAGTKSLAVFVDEQGLLVEGFLASVRVAESKVLLDCLQSRGTDGRKAFLFAFAADVEDFAKEVNIT